MTPSPPEPAELVHLKATDATGALVAAGALGLTGVALALSARPEWWWWLLGQVLLALSLVQWFSLLHECGHETVFHSRWPNVVLGQVAAFFSLIPFPTWQRIHGRHHKWTGWQDVDPTTASLVPRALGPLERVAMNVCWGAWLPAFSVVYRVGNFWNWPRLRRLFEQPEDRRAMGLGAVALVLAYAGVGAALGPALMLRLLGLALFLALMAEDLIILSQHTHVPQQVSDGGPVRAYTAREQEVFTRSLVFPRWLAALLLNIDAHGLHHMYPFVPGYRLGAIDYVPANTIHWWTWTRRARALRGEVFLFQNRLTSGVSL